VNQDFSGLDRKRAGFFRDIERKEQIWIEEKSILQRNLIVESHNLSSPLFGAKLHRN
jgi:hypothetical protein